MPRISHLVNLLTLEHSVLMRYGDTMSIASTECMHMNTGRVVAHSGQHKQEIVPF